MRRRLSTAVAAITALTLTTLACPAEPTPAAPPAPPATVPAPRPHVTEALALRGEHATASRSVRRSAKSHRPARAATKPVARKARTAPPRRAAAHRPAARRAVAAHQSRAAARVVAYARTQLGRPYTRGRLDCSGLTMRSYARAGVPLPHKAARQNDRGKRVSRSGARAGDLVFWGGADAYHVAIYLGRGRVIHAPKPGDRVKVSRIWGSPSFVRVLR